MTYIAPKLRQLVLKRSNGRCEYCCLSQAFQEATFHIDHAIPQSQGGSTDADNLALACVSRSLRKGARTSATDPKTGVLAVLFNPRTHIWQDHFQWSAEILIGNTSIGRATISLLSLNRPVILKIRLEEAAKGRHPPA